MGEALGGWDAYIAALVRIESPDGALWLKPAPIFRAEGRFPDRDGRTVSVVTAHNPGGRRASDRANAAAQARLEAEVGRRGLTWWPAAGGDPSWTHVEASVALVGVREPDAIALGAAFGQEAIFIFTRADRRIASCTDDGRVETTGWTSTDSRT